jgi:rod shape-determining protein MreD
MVVAFLGETIIAPVIAIAGIAPDFAVIAVVILALAEGSTAAVLGGFFVGLIQDLAVPNLLGLHALCKTLLGSAVGRLHGRLVYGMPVVEGTLLLLASLAHDTLFLLVQSSMESDAFLVPLISQALPTALYTALVGVPLLRLADFLGILRRED